MKIRLIPYFELPCPACKEPLQFPPFLLVQTQTCPWCKEQVQLEMKRPFFQAFRKVYRKIEDVLCLEKRIARTLQNGTPAIWAPRVTVLPQKETTEHKEREHPEAGRSRRKSHS